MIESLIGHLAQILIIVKAHIFPLIIDPVSHCAHIDLNCHKLTFLYIVACRYSFQHILEPTFCLLLTLSN